MQEIILQLLNCYYDAKDPKDFESQNKYNKKVAKAITKNLTHVLGSSKFKIVNKK